MKIAQFSVSEDMIDLGVGQPQTDLLPLELLHQAADYALSHASRQILQYGAEAGNDYVRSSLAGFLSRHYQHPVRMQSLFITNGISQALAMICTLFTKPGDTIFVEEPTYFYALEIFRDYDLNLVSVPMNEDGLDLEYLRQLLKQHQPKFIYTIPAFQNPSGTTMSLPTREGLLELAETFKVLVVADEVYHLLHYGLRPPKPLGCFASERVLSLGSFAKILGPGLRLGWIQASGPLLLRMAEYGAIVSGGGLNPFTSAIVGSAIDLGLQDRHLQELKDTYAQRGGALVQALRDHGFSVPEVQGGYFVWLKLDQDTRCLQHKARAHKVDFKPGHVFSSEGGLQNYMRLCFAFYSQETLLEGVDRLVRAIRE